jgi:hypothetical protein
MTSTAVLVHSPLVGPATWQAVAARLAATGRTVVVPDLRPALLGPGPRVARQVELVATAVGAATPPAERVVLVAHSGAGPLLPVLVERLASDGFPVVAAVFVDAALPHPGRSRLQALPPDFAADLTARAIEGAVPPWPTWWPAEQLDALVGADLRALLLADSPPLPLDLFTEAMPIAQFPPTRLEYVRLSAAYDEEADTAEAQGWVVRRLDADHLALLTDPDRIAALLG